ncbi:unnamed protein product, partial [Mesorhabditis belari]|uniref:G-protein coupled receptors family 1 profile domain-containing protein n=1 Tax=Mesorhabditis belari TaxID=2138241 RepID=A0AAF3FQL6_9BILA
MNSTSNEASTDASTEKIFYTLFVCFGLPMNISTFFYMMKRYKHARSFLLLLHINLNLTDILVLGPSLIGKLGWLITEDWLAGDLMCRLMRFVDMFAFMASSNIMVCIALYRLYALRYPLWVSAVGHSRVPRMLFSAWVIAAMTSLPQLFLWQEAMIGGRPNCVNTWMVDFSPETFWNDGANKMLIYVVASSIVVFYIPCAILVICYVLILKDIYATLTYDSDASSVLYIAELTRLSSCGRSSKEKQQLQQQQIQGNAVALHPQQSSLRGQDRFQRAKIRSLRITLFLILCYVVTWLPYNMLIWVMVYDLSYYMMTLESKLYFLNCLVYFNSVINPFIYGRCQGLKMLWRWRNTTGQKKSKHLCWILQH